MRFLTNMNKLVALRYLAVAYIWIVDSVAVDDFAFDEITIRETNAMSLVDFDTSCIWISVESNVNYKRTNIIVP